MTEADGEADVILAFHTARAELERELPALRERMEKAAGLWIAWPKRASKMETDLTEDVVRELALANTLVDNKVCAIDETWSGLRLGLSSRRLRHGRAVAVSGTVFPTPTSGRVEVRIERLVRRRWKRVQRKRIVVRRGRYLTRVKLRRKGLHRVSVIVPGATKRLRVRAR